MEPVNDAVGQIIEHNLKMKGVCRDADDDNVLACALGAKAEYLVTGMLQRDNLGFKCNWVRIVLMEEILPRGKGAKYPLCIDGARACPHEDCGWSHGYEDFLSVIMDPDHGEHDSMLEWERYEGVCLLIEAGIRP